MSNVTSEWAEWNPDTSDTVLDPAVLLEIARGIPRSFPLREAIYILDKIPWSAATTSDPEPLATKRKRSTTTFPGGVNLPTA